MTTHEGGTNTAPSSDSPTGSIEASPLLRDPSLPLSGIQDPSDTDVLCGRGGAALRHPGNQTYRRLVHLNKGLYITCMKAEKLKISRSIVAAIREQNGRFLEKRAAKGTWYDIGDKKAMEKTSQALREGQPKLRQKIVELGGGVAGAAALLETQFASQQQSSYSSLSGLENSVPAASQQQQQQPQQQSYSHHQQQHSMAAMPQTSMHSIASAPAGMTTAVPRPSYPQLSSPAVMQHINRHENEGHHQAQHQRPSLTAKGEAAAAALGVSESTLNIMNSFSNFGMQERIQMPPVSAAQLHHHAEDDLKPRPLMPGHGEGMRYQEEHPAQKVDRRRVFAKMKHPQEVKKAEAMQDIHLGEGTGSLTSNMTFESNDPHPKVPSIAEIFASSRRSVMSGTSKTSDAENSIISDLSKKIGNVSTRSLLSEISGMDEESVDGSIDTRDMPTPNATMDMYE